jgi:uncharacterized membrane protein YdjX (TVP38/TMEM64 family)
MAPDRALGRDGESMNRKRLLLLGVVAALVAAWFVFDLGRWLSLESLRAERDALAAAYAANPLAVGAAFFGLYVAVAGLCLPGALLLTVAAGAIFGLLPGLVLVSFASSIGATLAFLASRLLLREAIQSRYKDKLRAVNAGIEREGAFYLFSMRLVPAFPFFLVNLVMGLTPIRAWTFYWVSQVGMLAGTVVYVNAGTQLARLESLNGLLSPVLFGSFVLLAVFPLIAKKLLESFHARRGKRAPAA